MIDKTEILEDQSSENEDKIDNPDAKWFVIHTLSGQEEKVKRFIENTVKLKGLEYYIVEVIIPTEDVVEMRRGKRRTVAKKFFPSYMIVRMVMMKETEGFIRSVPGVTGFITLGDEPVPLSEEGEDSVSNIAAVCPNCHRELHYANNKEELAEARQSLNRFADRAWRRPATACAVRPSWRRRTAQRSSS